MSTFQEIGVKAVVQGLKQYEADLAKVNSKTVAIGKAVVGALAGAAVGAAVGVLGSRFAKLDQTMAGVSARAGLTEQQTDKLTDSVIRLSKSNLQTQEEIALTGEALISLQGVEADNQEQIERLTQKYLDYALVTGQTAPDAVAAFDDILDAWNLTAEDGTAIMDALVVSHQKFGTDIPSAQAALNTYASTFQTLGLDINDALGYINLFAESGIDAESSAAAFNKAVGLLTENSDASNKKIAEMAANLGMTADEFEAFKQADPATQFDILTKAIAETEDPMVRAQAAIDLFGAKAGPKLAEALAGNKLADFQVSMEESAGASEEAADKIQGTLINKLKLLGNEVTGRAMELTRDFAPALQLMSVVGPQAAGAIGGVAGALGSIKIPDLSGFLSQIGGIASAPFSLAGDVTQTITQKVVRTGDKLITAFGNRIQNITQRVTKIEVTPDAEQQAERAGAKAGEKAGGKFAGSFAGAFTNVTLGGLGAALGTGIATAITVLSASTVIAASVAALVVVLSAAYLIGMAKLGLMLHPHFEKFWQHTAPDFIATSAVAIASAMAGLGQMLFDEFVAGVTAFFTPENIGRRLADLVALAVIAMFAPLIITIKFREQIASVFEAIGSAILEAVTALPGFLTRGGNPIQGVADWIIGGLAALPGFLAGIGLTVGETILDVLMTEIQFPLIGGVKVWEMIAGAIFPGAAALYEFFKQGIAAVLTDFLFDLPSLVSEGLNKAGEGIGIFFSEILPDLLTGEYLPELADAFVTFFGETLPDLITVEVPKIPGALLDVLEELPGQVLGALEEVTATVTGWVTNLASWVTDNFIPWNWIKEAAQGFIDEIKGWLNFIWGDSIINDWVRDLAAWMTENFNPWNWVKAAVEGFDELISTALDAVVTVFSGLPRRIINGLDSNIGPMVIWFAELPGKVIGWMGDVGGSLFNKGKDLMEGFILGAIKKIEEIPERVVKKTQDTIESAANGFGLWDSPSPWMRQRGNWLVEGFVQGAEDQMPNVQSIGRELSDALQSGTVEGWAEVEAWLQSRGDSVWAAFKPLVAKMADAGYEAATAFNDAFGHTLLQGHQEGIPGMPGGGGSQSIPGDISDPFLPERPTRMGIIMGQILDQIGVDLEHAILRWNALPDAMRVSLGESTTILQEFANAGATVFEDYFVRSAEMQAALDHVRAGHASLREGLLLATAGFTELSDAVILYNVGLLSSEELARLLMSSTEIALLQYDLLGESLEKAKDKSLGLVDAQKLAKEGFGSLTDAILQYNAGLITADELTAQVQEAFTEIATSAEVLGAQWTMAFADSLARQDLLEQVGSAGVRILDQLNLVLTEGGERNVQALADMVTGLLEELESDLPADQADEMGAAITEALEQALIEGTPEAIQAVIDLMDAANDAMEAGTTEILSSVEKFNRNFGDLMADRALQDRVGSNGADLMDALNKAIETGGEQGVAKMAEEAFDIIDAMEKELEPGQADFLGDTLMAALQTALETGGDGAVQAVIDILAQIQGLISNAPTTIPVPQPSTPLPPTKDTNGGRDDHDNDTGGGGGSGYTSGRNNSTYWNNLLTLLTGVDVNEGEPMANAIGFLNSTFRSRLDFQKHLHELFDLPLNKPLPFRFSQFHRYLKDAGLAFAHGGVVTVRKPTMLLAGEGARAEDVFIRPHAMSPADLLADTDFSSLAASRQQHMGTRIMVNPSLSFVLQTIDWNRVRQIARDTVETAIGQAASQYQRSGVAISDGVG